MKKWISLLLCVCMAAGFSACKTEQPVEIDESGALNAVTGALSDYIVMKENTAYVYRGDTNPIADYLSYVEYTGEGVLQRRLIASNQYLAEVYRFDDKTMDMVYTENMYYRHENLLDRESNVNIQWIGTPLKAGAAWTYTTVPYGVEITAKVTATNVTVTVPYGTFQTIEVTRTYSDDPDFTTKKYFAKGVGLVKETSILGDTVISSELCEVHENVAFQASTPMFYMENGERVYDNCEISYTTNMDTMELYNRIFPAFFAEKFDLDEAALHLESFVIDYAEYSNPVLSLNFPDTFAWLTISGDAVRCMADTYAYLFGIEEVRFKASGMNIHYADVEQDEEGVMMYTPLPDVSAGEIDLEIVDGADVIGD